MIKTYQNNQHLEKVKTRLNEINSYIETNTSRSPRGRISPDKKQVASKNQFAVLDQELDRMKSLHKRKMKQLEVELGDDLQNKPRTPRDDQPQLTIESNPNPEPTPEFNSVEENCMAAKNLKSTDAA